MNNAVTVTLKGFDELAERLSFLRDRDALKVGRAALGAMARTTAKNIRRFIKPSIAPKTADKGIGSRVLKARSVEELAAKAGVAVGSAGKNARKMRVVNRGRRRGQGVDARNLHWFGLGTNDRYSGAGRTRSGKKRQTTRPRHFTGRIDKTKWGGFVEKGAQASELVAEAAAAKAAEKVISKLDQS